MVGCVDVQTICTANQSDLTLETSPGMVYTPMMYASGMTDEVREKRKNRSLLKTEGTAWDVGAAIRFLAGDEARWYAAFTLNRCLLSLTRAG